MNCPSCGAPRRRQKPFCTQCGSSFGLRCGRCGAEAEPGDRFCADCGSPISEASPPAPAAEQISEAACSDAAATSPPIDPPLGAAASNSSPVAANFARAERKQVTVMFCDLVGSTALAERLDPEDFRELLDQYLEIAIRAVHHFEGMVNQLAGDGFMALFGAPLAHENDAQRAVLAALEIQTALGRLDRELRARRGIRLQARIGIHSGPAVVGAVGNELKADYSAIGDTTHTAARLESLAPPGAILISAATYRAVRRVFSCRPAGPLPAKGKSEPVEAYEVLEALSSPRSGSETHELDAGYGLTPFVGRDAHLDQLLACFAALDRGVPQLVVVSGGPGSGKSRLLFELRQRLAERDLAWFETRGSPFTQLLPYVPWAKMLRRYLEAEPDTPAPALRARLKQKAEELDPALLPETPWLELVLGLPVSFPEPPSERKRKLGTFGAVSQLVRAELRRHPVVLVVEDLHWIDPPSLEMLQAALQAASGPVLFWLSHRPDFLFTPQSPAVQTLLPLGPLSREAVSTIVRSIGGERLSIETVEQILQKAEGNPFLAEELTRSVLENSAEGGGVLPALASALPLPSTVQEVIVARIDRLPPAAKRTLQVASVLGREFSRGMLARLLTEEGIEVDQQLAELERRGVLHRRFVFSADEYRFGESLTQEVAYSTLLLKERKALHERASQLLEGQEGLDRSSLALLLHHASHTDNPARAARSLLRAAQAAEEEPSYQVAADLYRKAWEMTAPHAANEQPARLALHAVKGLARMHVIYGAAGGDHRQIFARASEIARQWGEPSAAAALTIYDGLALGLGHREDFAAALERVEGAFAEALQQKDYLEVNTVCDAARAAAYMRLRDGRFAESLQALDQALRFLDEAGQRDPATDLYCGTRWLRAHVLFFAERFAAAREECHATEAIAQRAGNRKVSSAMVGLRGHIAFEEGDFAAALELCQQALDMAPGLDSSAGSLRDAAYAVLAARKLGTHAPLTVLRSHVAQLLNGSDNLSLGSHVIAAALLGSGDPTQAVEFTEITSHRAGGQLSSLHASIARLLCSVAGADFDRAGLSASELSQAAQNLGLRFLARWAEQSASPLAA